ncbi:cysteine desulfurase family protein [Virgibacillus sp. SK37]|uniref:cysteine desulfurase family protein n=1 Tax=Virgibacillus sp. SK37 TaxID=403957 RepID=UPI0004D1C59C|nr:cysteine desulfurase family protein [Virgibacillus sp. SK37]AIF43188.1 aminotransferase V [Virgibacillus sp. SK37]
MIYLDNSATTIPDPSVIKSFEQASAQFFANPSSIHQLGGQSEQLLTKAKNQVASILDVTPSEVIFTSGGTEGNNTAIKGIALEHHKRGKHIITTEIEHPSVYDACKSLEDLGFDVTYLPVNKNGVISIEDLEAAIRKDTILISIMHVNNEIGTIQPIEKIGEICKQYPKLFLHVDHVQGFGKVPLDLKNCGIDLCTLSGHKIHGLKGTGILYMRQGVKLFPLFHGGNQEQSFRSGTENLAGAVSLGKALRLIKEKEQTQGAELKSLQAMLREKLTEIAEVQINTPPDAAPHIMNFSVPGTKPEVIIHMLGEQEIYISTKSACSSKQKEESRILLACGHSKERASSAYRVSMSYSTTKEDILQFADYLQKAINQFRKVME